MSVVIKGFDKPSDCDYCTLQDYGYCSVLLSFINVEHGIDTRCPLVEIKDMTNEEFDAVLARLMADRETEPLKTADYCDICKQDMCKDCIADATNPYCVPSHYEIKQTEPTGYNLSPVEDEPQKIGYCNECKWFRDKQVCGRCRSKNLYAPKDEPQTDCAWK